MSQAHDRARALHEARRTRKPVPPFTDADPALGEAEGYETQAELLELLLADGDEVIGYKVGLTSAPARKLLGIDSPDHGPLLASAVYRDGGTLPLDRFIAPKIEAEIALRLGSPLKGPGVTVEQAREAVSEVRAGVEIVDSRIEDWRIRIADTVSDLASTGAIAVSDTAVPLEGFEPRLVGMVLSRNGEVVDTGVGAAALGDPVAVLAWLANSLAGSGRGLEPGQLVLTGALHTPIALEAGDVFTAEFDRLGSLTLRVAETV
ncbi:2-keto-4-pentenoate hydratase [Nocardiopsis sp. NPDC055824]